MLQFVFQVYGTSACLCVCVSCVHRVRLVATALIRRGRLACMRACVCGTTGAGDGLLSKRDLADLMQFVDHDYLEANQEQSLPALVAMYAPSPLCAARGCTSTVCYVCGD